MFPESNFEIAITLQNRVPCCLPATQFCNHAKRWKHDCMLSLDCLTDVAAAGSLLWCSAVVLFGCDPCHIRLYVNAC